MTNIKASDISPDGNEIEADHCDITCFCGESLRLWCNAGEGDALSCRCGKRFTMRSEKFVLRVEQRRINEKKSNPTAFQQAFTNFVFNKKG